jgi:hypothetical protein
MVRTLSDHRDSAKFYLLSIGRTRWDTVSSHGSWESPEAFFPQTELGNHRSEAHVTIRVWDALGVSDDETTNGDVWADGDDQPITEEGREERGLMGDEAIER